MINRLYNLPWQLSRDQKNWLKTRTLDHRPEVREAAKEQYNARFGHYISEIDIEDSTPAEDEFEEYVVDALMPEDWAWSDYDRF